MAKPASPLNVISSSRDEDNPHSTADRRGTEGRHRGEGDECEEYE
jgi:hypothetical protein